MKYILIYPGGGLNDILCVIERCLAYAVKTNRIIVIDTAKASWMKRDIHEYILFSHPNIYLGALDTIYNRIPHLKLYPSSVKELLPQLSGGMYWRPNGTFTRINDINLGIDLTKVYSEDIIVYASAGGGLPSNILKYIQMKPVVTTVYIERKGQLPENFVGVHIRNTDIKSDIEKFITIHNKILSTEPVFLGSDDYNTIEFFKQKFNTIKTFANIPALPDNARNLHTSNKFNPGFIDQSGLIIDCIVDMLLLASSKTYLYSSVKSGYSKLANYLFTNKDILNKILGNQTPKKPACAAYNCVYARHSNKMNNDGTYCCKSCKSGKGHGPACEKQSVYN